MPLSSIVHNASLIDMKIVLLNVQHCICPLLQVAILEGDSFPDFEETEISRFLENRIHSLILRQRRQRAQELNCDPDSVPAPNGLRVRLFLNNVLLRAVV